MSSLVADLVPNNIHSVLSPTVRNELFKWRVETFQSCRLTTNIFQIFRQRNVIQIVNLDFFRKSEVSRSNFRQKSELQCVV